MEAQADIVLIAACQQGDHRAFRQVFEIYRDRVFSLCRSMSGSDEDAEDLTQDAFVAAFKGVAGFRGESSFGTWLYRIAANRCSVELRRRQPRFQEVEEAERQNVLPLSTRGNQEEQLVRKELVKRVQAAIADLPESQRLIFVLGTQMGMRYREIGEIVGCSEDAVKVRIHRARKRVRDALKPYMES